MLFQEYMFNISEGEISLIMIGNEFTHAVKKTAKKGDFRVQDDHGGKVEIYNPNKHEISFAKECLKKRFLFHLYTQELILSMIITINLH